MLFLRLSHLLYLSHLDFKMFLVSLHSHCYRDGKLPSAFPSHFLSHWGPKLLLKSFLDPASLLLSSDQDQGQLIHGAPSDSPSHCLWRCPSTWISRGHLAIPLKSGSLWLRVHMAFLKLRTRGPLNWLCSEQNKAKIILMILKHENVSCLRINLFL